MRVLFVCLGNICRSPSAEAVFRTRSDIATDSAGTGGWHAGDPPYGPMQKAAARRGFQMSDLRARQITAADFTRFSHIVAMDGQNLADLRAMGATGGAHLSCLMDHAPEAGVADVPDPYYTRDFDGALDLIEQGVDGLIRTL